MHDHFENGKRVLAVDFEFPREADDVDHGEARLLAELSWRLLAVVLECPDPARQAWLLAFLLTPGLARSHGVHSISALARKLCVSRTRAYQLLETTRRRLGLPPDKRTPRKAHG
jgi:hypothetical protein